MITSKKRSAVSKNQTAKKKSQQISKGFSMFKQMQAIEKAASTNLTVVTGRTVKEKINYHLLDQGQ
jgi:hypothetical protein